MNPFTALFNWIFGGKPVTETQPDPVAIAAALDEPFEGFSATPYRDPVGIWTIGYGSTRDGNDTPVTASTPPITESQAVDLLMRDMHSAFTDIALAVKVPLTANESAALASLIYNIGAGAFNNSTLLRLLNAGQYEAAAAQFDLWDHAAGKILAGLLRRRMAEKALFEKS